MSGTKKIHYGRTFLNLPGHHGGAHIITEVERVFDYVDAVFIIQDCNRIVTLDFNFDYPKDTYTRSTLRNVEHKLKILDREFSKFRDALMEEIKVAKENIDRQSGG